MLIPIAFASCLLDWYCPVANISSNFRLTSCSAVTDSTAGDPSNFRYVFMASELKIPYSGSRKKSKVMQTSRFFQ